ncbi:hypothetical protein GCM10009557_77730 [Virgisporangium ochraceum]|uniref:Putative restriction endonuclease domain-containing protein n=1 Tax=Virgisporangium ochraceum TaxID=65505 RepID=A0A8J3ZPB6_9ACTN|nr:hypothetical protein Voc01_003250 [Virgisporangium ochraceum]
MTADDADIHDAPIWLPGEWTVDDLESTPDDGRRYELFDGKMVVSPAPINLHQLALRAIFLSKGSRKLDLEVKAQAYATNGVDLYWTFDPRKRHVVARRRHGLAYVEIATASGGQRVRLDEPFPVEICPAELVRV